MGKLKPKDPDDLDLDDEGSPDVEWFPLPEAMEDAENATTKIIATRGDGIYLVSVDGLQGFVADLGTGLRYAPHSIQSILARGYWDEAADDPKVLKRILALPVVEE